MSNERDAPPPPTDAELRKVRDVPLEAVLLLGPQTARIAAELLAARARIAELETEVAQDPIIVALYSRRACSKCGATNEHMLIAQTPRAQYQCRNCNAITEQAVPDEIAAAEASKPAVGQPTPAAAPGTCDCPIAGDPYKAPELHAPKCELLRYLKTRDTALALAPTLPPEPTAVEGGEPWSHELIPSSGSNGHERVAGIHPSPADPVWRESAPLPADERAKLAVGQVWQSPNGRRWVITYSPTVDGEYAWLQERDVPPGDATGVRCSYIGLLRGNEWTHVPAPLPAVESQPAEALTAGHVVARIHCEPSSVRNPDHEALVERYAQQRVAQALSRGHDNAGWLEVLGLRKQIAELTAELETIDADHEAAHEGAWALANKENDEHIATIAKLREELEAAEQHLKIKAAAIAELGMLLAEWNNSTTYLAKMLGAAADAVQERKHAVNGRILAQEQYDPGCEPDEATVAHLRAVSRELAMAERDMRARSLALAFAEAQP